MAVPRIWRNIPEKYNLIGSHCKDCDKLYFPKREVCLECGSQNFENYKFKGKGKIVTFTVIRTSSVADESKDIEIPARNSPYTLAVIELIEGPKLTAEIVDSENVEIGQDVEMVFRKILEFGKKGIIKYGYKFKIV